MRLSNWSENGESAPLPAGRFVSQPWRILGQPLLLALPISAAILFAMATGLVAIHQGLGLIPLPYNLFLVDQALPGLFKLHMLASGAVLVLTPLVLALRRRPTWHRPLGRLTAGLVIAGALTAFPVAILSSSVLPARVGFIAQAIVWLALLVIGVKAARTRQINIHRTAMLAMTAVSSGAIFVRLTTAAAVTAGLPFDPIYATAAWVGWLVPLGVVLYLCRDSLSALRPRERLAPAAALE